MHQHPGLLAYRFRFVFVGLLFVACILLLSALMTAIGANTVLAAKTNTTTVDTYPSEGPNAVLNGAYRFVNSAQSAGLSVGTALYGASSGITNFTVASGRGIVHGSRMAVRTVGAGIGGACRGVAGAAVFALHAPAQLIRHVPAPTVSTLLRPADSQPTPVISQETSAAVLARLSAQQQQEIASLQAAQLVANRQLGGSIAVAGDPSHGGYPANWDAPAPQDSRLDSWGMYNRECVSYAAWKVFQTYGHMPYWGGVGNASQWIGDARAAGIPTGSTPRVHSVAISSHGYYGHAMWVEKVLGNMIYVSQYNYDLTGHYSEMWVDGSYFTYIYFQ